MECCCGHYGEDIAECMIFISRLLQGRGGTGRSGVNGGVAIGVRGVSAVLGVLQILIGMEGCEVHGGLSFCWINPKGSVVEGIG